MHQIVSTISSLLLSPFNWIVLLVIAGLVFQKKGVKQTCVIAAICIFFIFSNPFLIDWYAQKWQPLPVAVDPSKNYSCGIVLGGFASPDRHEQGYFNATADRFIETLKLYKTGEIKNIMVCGGNGKTIKKDFKEAIFVKNELITMGVPASAILVEDRSNNTAENAANAKEIFDSLQLKPPYLLITSAHHMARAALLFSKAGINTEPFPCNYFAGRGLATFSTFIPDPAVLGTWNYYLKETAGYYYYK